MLFHVPKCEYLLRWLSIASGMQIVFVHVPLCVYSLPMPGASQTWGVNRSLRMGFNDTGSSGRACFKAEAGRNSSRTCVHSTRLCPCMHASNVPSWWMSSGSFQPLVVTLSWGITQDCACFCDFCYCKVNVKCHKQTPLHKWVFSQGTLREAKYYQTNYTHQHAKHSPKHSKDSFQNTAWMD